MNKRIVNERVVIDTNVFVSALISADGTPNDILRLCFQDIVTPLMGMALYMEYCDVNERHSLFQQAALSKTERLQLLDDFMSLCDWVPVYYLWRPNLHDEGDNHLIELALAGGASHIITGNKKDFVGGELLFPDIQVVTPKEFLNDVKQRRH